MLKLKNNKIFNIIYKILKTLLGFFLFIVLIVILVQKFSNNRFAIGGYRIYNVATESMKDEYSVGDIIIVEKVNAEDLKVGDNITYLGKSGQVADLIITHKIVSIRHDNGEYYIITKGIQNEVEDPEISFSQVYGRVCYKMVVFSFIGRLMTNIFAYYILFTSVGLFASIQIVKSIFARKQDLEDEEDETEISED